MMSYAYYDTQHGMKQTKFGDHFVEGDYTEQDAVYHTMRYMRTQFPRRGRYFDSESVLKKVWDITEIAKEHKRFYPHSHIDDIIGDVVGRRGTKQGREFHHMGFDELVVKVNQFINKSLQSKPVAMLSQWQHDAAEDVLVAMADSKRVILAELCARFGKTIWAGALARETGSNLTVVASYVLTSFASFAKDLTEFEQFRYMEVIDSAEDDYQEQIAAALSAGQQVIVFLSMCGGGKRQDRIDYLFNINESRLVFIDEADYGAHTDNQTLPFIAATKPTDTVVLMTGTNGERACGAWKIDHYLGTTYAELLIARAEEMA
jgi:hypothetical protein